MPVRTWWSSPKFYLSEFFFWPSAQIYNSCGFHTQIYVRLFCAAHTHPSYLGVEACSQNLVRLRLVHTSMKVLSESWASTPRADSRASPAPPETTTTGEGRDGLLAGDRQPRLTAHGITRGPPDQAHSSWHARPGSQLTSERPS